jgi:hypothetical protein
VVLGQELEDNHVSNGHVLQRLRLEDETSRAADLDGVRSTRGGRGSSLSRVDGDLATISTRDDGSMALRSNGDGLGHSDLVLESGGSSVTAGVLPNDDDGGSTLDLMNALEALQDITTNDLVLRRLFVLLRRLLLLDDLMLLRLVVVTTTVSVTAQCADGVVADSGRQSDRRNGTSQCQ